METSGDDVIVFYVTTSINGGERPRLDRVPEAAEISVKIETANGGREGVDAPWDAKPAKNRSARSMTKPFSTIFEGINLRNDLVSRSGITGSMECVEETHRGTEYVCIYIYILKGWKQIREV